MGVMLVGCGGCSLGPATIRLAEAVAPFPASLDVTAPVVLVCVPDVVPVTFTAKLQDALAVSEADERLTLFDPATAAIVPPPQLPVRPLGLATICPDGSASVKPIPLNKMLALGLERLKASDVVPFSDTLPDPYALVIFGGSFAGGGGVEFPDEPLPHATVPASIATKPAAVTMKKTEHEAPRGPAVIDAPSSAEHSCFADFPAVRLDHSVVAAGSSGDRALPLDLWPL
jgi:hypothetical protein